MDNMNINYRKSQIENLDLFIQEKQILLNDVLSQLGWKEESLLEEMKVTCPRNSGHWVPESSLSHHKEVCEWTEDGYLKDELKKQPPDSNFFYQTSSTVIPVLIDNATQEKVLSECGLPSQGQSDISDMPKTYDRWTVHLSPEQRLAMYDYVVQVGKTADKPKNLTVEDLMFDFEKKDDQDDTPKSKLEILAEIRDYKRRRQSYRAKNVHITKKSYTEIMKEVIENQTSYLAEVGKCENSEDPNKEYEDLDLSDGSQSNSYSTKKYTDSGSSSKVKEKYPEEKDNSRKHHHSRYESSKSYSPKRKKHKRDRSRSRSQSRHKHKKSHKHKRSHDY